MIIKEREYKICKECKSRKLISGEEYGCDACKERIVLGKHDTYLQATLFKHPDGHQDFHFCSWDCVFKKLKTVSTDYFISLPYLQFDEKNQKRNAKGFWEAIKSFAEESKNG